MRYLCFASQSSTTTSYVLTALAYVAAERDTDGIDVLRHARVVVPQDHSRARQRHPLL